jgi:hypothetical protein
MASKPTIVLEQKDRWRIVAAPSGSGRVTITEQEIYVSAGEWKTAYSGPSIELSADAMRALIDAHAAGRL